MKLINYILCVIFGTLFISSVIFGTLFISAVDWVWGFLNIFILIMIGVAIFYGILAFMESDFPKFDLTESEKRKIRKETRDRYIREGKWDATFEEEYRRY